MISRLHDWIEQVGNMKSGFIFLILIGRLDVTKSHAWTLAYLSLSSVTAYKLKTMLLTLSLIVAVVLGSTAPPGSTPVAEQSINSLRQALQYRPECGPRSDSYYLDSPPDVSSLSQNQWRCDNPLSTPNAIDSCLSAFVNRLQVSCPQSNTVCLYPPSSSLTSARIETVESNLWNVPYPQITPYPGQQSAVASIAQIPCTGYVSDVTLLLAEGNFILRNMSKCVLDRQMLGRFVQVVRAVQGLNSQCVLSDAGNIAPPDTTPPAPLYAPPPTYIPPPPTYIPPPSDPNALPSF